MKKFSRVVDLDVDNSVFADNMVRKNLQPIVSVIVTAIAQKIANFTSFDRNFWHDSVFMNTSNEADLGMGRKSEETDWDASIVLSFASDLKSLINDRNADLWICAYDFVACCDGIPHHYPTLGDDDFDLEDMQDLDDCFGEALRKYDVGKLVMDKLSKTEFKLNRVTINVEQL